MGKFADKSEMRKQVKSLEQQMKNLYDLLLQLKTGAGSGGGSLGLTGTNFLPGMDSEDDAMIAKKPLGGWSCISCEKNLVNL